MSIINTVVRKDDGFKMNESIKVISKKLNDEELAQVVDILVEAFKNDPFVKRNYSKYEDFRVIMELETKYGNEVGIFVLAMDGDKIVGVHLGLPPGVKEFSLLNVMNKKYFKQVIKILKNISFKTVINMIKVSSAFSENKIKYCYYWLLVAVREDYCGLGIGRKVIEYAMDMCDEPVPIYIESSNPKNNKFYKSLGFEVMKVDDIGVCCMVKTP